MGIGGDITQSSTTKQEFREVNSIDPHHGADRTIDRQTKLDQRGGNSIDLKDLIRTQVHGGLCRRHMKS